VFTADNSAKSLLADERMTVSTICRQLAEKNHIIMDPKCSIVEHIPELYLGMNFILITIGFISFFLINGCDFFFSRSLHLIFCG
jgi:hypothetical protein